MQAQRWEFWLDVGGTFTDCIARRPDGSLARAKVLSSGVIKGSCADGTGGKLVVDPLRATDPPGVWKGFRLRLPSRASGEREFAVVASTPAPGSLSLDRELPASLAAGTPYELFSDEDPVLVAVRYLLSVSADTALPPVNVRLGTTRGTNALLTRTGARTALVTTRGFADVLAIGYQNRPRLFELAIRRPEPLYADVAEIDERIAAGGSVLAPLDEEQTHQALAALRAKQIESLAICLLHSPANPAHEMAVERIARELGFCEISVSHRVSPLPKIIARGDTTVVDAYVSPILRRYSESWRTRLPGGEFRIMTSAGGLVPATDFRGKDCILSGPAGGVVGFSRAAQAAGFDRALGFDMGGTSTDVARFDGQFDFEYETEKAGVRLVAPMLAIHTVAAGGGSICAFDGVKLVVGPASAGAQPGPACYGAGGPLTVTDANLYLGRVRSEHFPFALDHQAVQRRLDEVAGQIRDAGGQEMSPADLAEGFVRVANGNMVRAIQAISLAKGYDPRDYVLVAFGGAAGQHACAVARELGIRQVLCHPDAGFLSALGVGQADVTRHAVKAVGLPYEDSSLLTAERALDELGEELVAAIAGEGVPASAISARRSLELRYQGLEASLVIESPSGMSYAEAYGDEHERLFGYRQHRRPLEIVAARVEAAGQVATRPVASRPLDPRVKSRLTEVQAQFGGSLQPTAVFTRAELAPGDRIEGPAIVCEHGATTVIEPGWRVDVLSGGELLLVDEGGGVPPTAVSADADPVMLEIFNQQFAAIAEQMGITLRNTSVSVNVKERLDFSCALFTSDGALVVNAPHLPVHLGSMGQTVRAALADFPNLAPGDVVVTNDPYRGGSHLPDITVVTPVFGEDAGELRFFTASRAHHAELGGISPGAMPPDARNLAEEGVLIRGFKLVDAGDSRFDEMERLLKSGPYPSRAAADNLADLAAQVAAIHRGASDLARLVERYSWPTVRAYMEHIRQAAATKTRQALAMLPAGDYSFTDHMDDGSPIAVNIRIEPDGPQRSHAAIDFSGTAGVSAGNLNANPAIVTAAVLYVLRCRIDEDIPLNEGVLEPVTIHVPEGLLRPTPGPTAETSPAVVGGNVETSQRVVDVLLGALGMAAASQGTMNNLLFGDRSFGYYETICGGSGATATAAGASAVHTHMTNTRLTDVEVLELKYPVRVREFSIRRDSGGAGRHRGGDGVRRVLEFLRPLVVSILAQRRGAYVPYGMQGGQAGAAGRNVLVRAGSPPIVLPSSVSITVMPGDVLWIETPGGGGWGS